MRSKHTYNENLKQIPRMQLLGFCQAVSMYDRSRCILGFLIMETWKNVINYEKFYTISNKGRIYSIVNKQYLKSANNGNGYLFVYLYYKNKKKHRYLHRLVAEAFIPNPENKPQINHKDLNKQNNRIENLEWATPSENAIHASKRNRLYCSEYQIEQIKKANSGIKSHLSKLNDENIKKIRRLKKETKMTNKQIALIFNVHRTTVGYILRRQTWKHI